MTTTHRLTAAAFYLCGLLILLHVDSVNSLTCKNCSFITPDCNSGNVAEIDCEPSKVCYAVRLFVPGDPNQVFTLRGCTAKNEGFHCADFADIWKECRLYCSTDNCNSASNIDDY